MQLRQYELLAANKLSHAGVDSPRLSARLICAEALGLESSDLYCEALRELSPEEIVKLDNLLLRRASGCPMAYILGHKEFYGRDFLLNGHCLIPRPETELLVDKALELLPEADICFADVGAGSGCIGLSLALERPAWRGILLDKSRACLELCAKNSKILGASHRISIFQGDIFALPFKASSLDLLVSNPPYIGLSERSQVMTEVLDFEPEEALFSGEDGLGHLMALVGCAERFLRPGGLLLLEHGYSQGPALGAKLRAHAFRDPGILVDLAGRERCTLAWRI